jgi:hypothetical protein
MRFQKNKGAVRRFSRLMRFASWLQRLPDRITPAPFRLLQIGSAFWQSRALYVAAVLDIATSLGDEELDAGEIGGRVSADPSATYRLLRMLAAVGIFEETAPRHFKNNRVSDYLRTDNPGSLRAMVLMHNAGAMSRPWYEHLERGIRQGDTPFELAHGESLYSYLDGHAEFDRLFAQAMDSVEALTGDSFATDFDWGRFDRLIDIGGSKGSKSLAILKRHPGLHALVVDRDQVILDARSHWNGLLDPGLLARMSFQAGDVFETVPTAESEKDIYLLCALLHGFDDAHAILALRNIAAAIGASGARIAIMEMILPEMKADLAGSAFDMQMLVAAGGRERTLAEWHQMFDHSGLQLEEVVGLRSLGSIMVLGRSGDFKVSASPAPTRDRPPPALR